jgi:tight adherence protein C
MSIEQTLLFATVTVAVSVAGLAWYVGLGVVRNRESNSARRLISLQPTREEVLEAAFSERAVAPIVNKVGNLFLRFTPQGWNERVNKRLVMAGWYPRFDANSWAAIRVVSILVAIVAYFFAQQYVVGTQKLLFTFFFAVLGVFGPEAIVTRRVDERKAAIERDVPDVIDLLVISVEAGLGFEAALGRVVQNVPGELSDEFSRMLQETRVGVSRHDAMKALAERTDVEDLNSFILAMNQADAFGVSIARMLRVQADEIRVRRRQRAQERAFAAPVKMVFPLVLCIFPAIFVVLLGPAMIQIFDTLLS